MDTGDSQQPQPLLWAPEIISPPPGRAPCRERAFEEGLLLTLLWAWG